MASKELIKLRKRKLRDGSFTLYLDYYKNGVRSYEYLKLYLIPETDKQSKLVNKATMEAALTIQAERTVDIQHGRANILTAKKNVVFSDYYRDKMETQIPASRVNTYTRALLLWEEYTGSKLFIDAITNKTMTGFSKFLQSQICQKRKDVRPLKSTTARKYFDCISCVLNIAVKENLINFNPVYKMSSKEKPQGTSDEREYLTLDEIRILINTPCCVLNLKKAFLFCCFTGLRKSDVLQLTWDMIEGNTIRKKAQKTQEFIYVPLSENAKAFLPEPGQGLIFDLKTCRSNMEKYLRQWIHESGIKKHITFHCSRHTFATLALTYGADLYTVSKLLGHHDIQTTQIYAKIVDEKKKEAVNLIPKI